MPAASGMFITTMIAGYAGGHLEPVLVAQPTEVGLAADVRGDGPGELTNAVATTLLGQGFTLILNLRELPARAGGWRVAARRVRPALLHLNITSRRGRLLYDGTAGTFDDWLALVDQSPWCLLYVATEPVPWPAQVSAQGAVDALATLVPSGSLVGARVPFTWVE